MPDKKVFKMANSLRNSIYILIILSILPFASISGSTLIEFLLNYWIFYCKNIARSYKFIFDKWILILSLLLTSSSFLSSFFAYDMNLSLKASFKWAIIILTSISLSYISSLKSNRYYFLSVLLIISSVALTLFSYSNVESFSSILTYQGGGMSIFRIRAGSLFVIPWCYALAWNSRSTKRNILLITLTITCLFTFSRSVWLACFIIYIIHSFIIKHSLRTKIIKTLIFFSIMSSLILFFPPLYKESMS